MQGKILKIKTGYNPNSSSIGVDMVIFFTAGAAITVLFNTMAAIFCAGKGKEEAIAAPGDPADPAASAKPILLSKMEEQG
jgi:hypothetical protein